MKKKVVLSMFASLVAVSMMLGPNTPIYAAEPIPVEQQLPAIPVKDLTKFDLLETWHYLSNAAGNPNPAIINNGDGTYNIIMFEGTAIVLDVNNPIYKDVFGHRVEIKNYEETESIVSELDPLCVMNFDDSSSIDHKTQIQLQGVSVGSAVVEIGVWNGDVFGETACQFEPNQNITIGVFVIPAQPGVQTPTYTRQQLSDISADEDAKDLKGKPLQPGTIIVY